MTAQQNYAGGNFTISGTDVAAKTGTSTYDSATLKKYGVPLSTSADNWNMTYSPDYVIALWYGYEKLSSEYYTDPIKASVARKAIMSAIAKKIYKTNSRFTVPSGVVKVEVEKETVPLQLPSAYTPSDMRITELFKSGTEPSEESFRYAGLENASNGKATISGNTINLTWDAAPTPKAIDENELQTYFNENYPEQYAQKYYDERISYNSQYIGTLGYAIYLDYNGSETYLGYTNNTSYSYNTNGLGGDYKFIIKTAYSIFKDNMSSGITISSSASGNTSEGTTYSIGEVTLNGSNSININVQSTDSYYKNSDDDGITVKDINGNDITNKVKIYYTIYKNGEVISSNSTKFSISLQSAATYKIEYSVEGYDQKLERTINVQ